MKNIKTNSTTKKYDRQIDRVTKKHKTYSSGEFVRSVFFGFRTTLDLNQNFKSSNPIFSFVETSQVFYVCIFGFLEQFSHRIKNIHRKPMENQ